MIEKQEQPIGQELALPEPEQFRGQLRAIRAFQAIAKAEMIEGHDYGVIPGTQRPTLLKPGAEKIAKLLGLADSYAIMDKTEDWGKPLFRYMVKCTLTSIRYQTVISEGLGECNTMEARYRWRWLWPSESQERGIATEGLVKRMVKTKGGSVPQYRVENDDLYSQVNTILKMAKKRALVDAALSAGRLSDVFTQDIEDFATKESFPEAERVGVVKEEEDGEPSLVAKAEKGLCPVHKVPYLHRKGTSKAGKPYDFWGCSKKNADGTYCQEKPGTIHFEDTEGGAPELQGQAEAASTPSNGSPAGESLKAPPQAAPAGAGPTGAPLKPDIPSKDWKDWAGFMGWVKEGWPSRTHTEVLKEVGVKVFPMPFNPKEALQLAQTLWAVWGPRRVSTEGLFPEE